MRVVFAGTPDPAVPALRELLASRHEVVGVVTRPDAPAGRGRKLVPSPVRECAEQHGLEVLTPSRASDPEFLDRLAELEPDCCPVVAYGALLREQALSIPRHGWVNLHFSLLPAWRGAAPVPAAIRHGDEITGATAFRIVPELDAGPVFGVVTEPIEPRDTSGSLLDRLSVSGARLLVATMDAIEDGTVHAEPQPSEGVSYAPKVTAEDAKVDFGVPARAVDRMIRSVTPDPGAWAWLDGKRFKLGPVEIPERDACEVGELSPGEISVQRRQVLVGTATVPVRLGEVQAHGKKRMPATDWARGVNIEQGTVLK
ncbi:MULTISPECIES: methionyl-tRNA formyltransferase [unclassified Actinopolyspora]|uniref:methionyl-tRNA formyltransferase n=1 Tax=Actinopolyspora TaxID=1849 RepID=UPI0013F65AEA|nr:MULTISPECIES: methionyl-tRNA formyltransferase [unclassified Actinopolyspora]NHD17573.1 methionyl-tRNA formyltransferase [Actinopolyspora sp. BKK2]NHE76694.1 methionyl-tRNA formyltransferase [Actinopolyspora sp. BKK1]